MILFRYEKIAAPVQKIDMCISIVMRFEGEYWAVFNRKAREMVGKRRCKDGDGTFVPSS